MSTGVWGGVVLKNLKGKMMMKIKLIRLAFALLAVTFMSGSSLMCAGESNSTFNLEYFVRIDPASGDANVVFVSSIFTDTIIIDNPVTGVSETIEPDENTVKAHPNRRLHIPGGLVVLRGAITGHTTCWVSVQNISVGEIRNARLHVRGFTETGQTTINSTNPPRTPGGGGLARGQHWREDYVAVFPSLTSASVVFEGIDGVGHFVMNGTIRR